MSFHLGQEIVCIKDWQQYKPHVPPEYHNLIPVQWEVYHCAGYRSKPDDPEPYIMLEEMGSGGRYAESGFRPVQKKSMGVLRSLLAPTPVKVPEDA